MTYENYSTTWNHVATNMMSYNSSIFAGWTAVPTTGSMSLPSPFNRYYFKQAIGSMVESIVNGVNGSQILCYQTHNWAQCCNYSLPPIPPHEYEQINEYYYKQHGYDYYELLDELHFAMSQSEVPPQDDCECTNASSIPLYNSFMQGLVLFMELRVDRPSPLFVNISFPVVKLAPGASIPLTLNFINPFGVYIDVAAVELDIQFEGVSVATYSVNGGPLHKKLLTIDANSNSTIKPSANAVFADTLSQTFTDALKGGNPVITSTTGLIEMKLMTVPFQVNYNLPLVLVPTF